MGETQERPQDKLPLAGRKLVVADDEPDQLMYLATVFEDYGATVVRAARQRTAWPRCR